MEKVGIIYWSDELGDHEATQYVDWDEGFFVMSDGELVDYYDFVTEHIDGPYTVGPICEG